MLIIDTLTSIQLFYSKRSQFVSGVEAEKVSVSVGQRVCTDCPASAGKPF